MGWLKEHGLIGNYDDYVGLPVAVLEDCQLAMQAEWAEQRKAEERKKSEAARGHRR